MVEGTGSSLPSAMPRMVLRKIFPERVNGTKVLGSIVGARIDLQEVFELHAAGKTHVVYERRQLEDVNSAIYEVETGQVKARLVFDLQ
jgi:alcohol dehydrogenase, propanol-preferring